MKCEKCKNDHDSSYGSGRFCSAACACSFSSNTNREETNKKISKSLKGKQYAGGGVTKHTEATKEKIKNKIILYHKKAREKIIENVAFENLPHSFIVRLLYEERGNKCEECGYEYTNTNTGKGPFEIHHKDGNHQNKKRENFQILCLNCHWKTPNYRFRGKKHKPESIESWSKKNKGNNFTKNYRNLIKEASK